MKMIETSMSTRYLKEFPDFIPEISTLIQRAEHTITILCDIPAYGFFSNNSDYNKYEYSIATVNDNNKIQIELICLEETTRCEFYSEEFLQKNRWTNPDQQWLEWKTRNESKLMQLSDVENEIYMEKGRVVKDLTVEQFVEILEKANKKMLDGAAFSGEKKKDIIKESMPVFFWIVDEKEAIFSIPSISEDGSFTEHGFFTHDQKIISALNSMKKRYLQRYDKKINAA